jgi:DNA-binding NarL/FixJ family response regulator
MNPLPKIKILLADDHHIFNDGLKRLIDEQTDLVVCGQVYQSKEIFAAINNERPKMVLLDVNLQGVNGIDIGKMILVQFPEVKVLALTMYNQPKLLEETRRAGLHGYLLKDTTTAKLLQAIKMILAGGTYFDKTVSENPSGRPNLFTDDFAQKLNLTFREIEIIRLIRAGQTNEEIAETLNLSFFTVKTHRKNIYFKLGLSNVAEVIEFAVKNGI